MQPTRRCKDTDALFFIHGIYGGENTFTNGTFNWPQAIARDFGDRMDVYTVRYDTWMLNWLTKDIASFDEIAEAFFNALQGQPKPGWGTNAMDYSVSDHIVQLDL
jgi:hypothetical protein